MSGQHGGRRPGAGRPPGTAWRASVSAMRTETIEKMRQIVASDHDPLSEVVSWIFDDRLDIQIRLGAASVALPFLYPRLSATTVDARHSVVKIDSNELLGRIADRIARLASPASGTIEATVTEPEQEVA